MRYEVIWTPDAERDLASVWLNAANRPAVTKSIHQLERDLSISPLSVGESRRSSVERIAYLEPVGISFSIIVDDLKVYVTAVTPSAP